MEKLKEYKYLLIIFVLFLINIFLFYGKMINIHTDFGRELLFSKMVAQGSVLYKDIFNTFVCPFSYLFNAFLLKFAPMNINTFYLAGGINCLVILGSVYFISKIFLNRSISSVITVFVMYYCCFYSGLMNFLTPYSYAVVYGLSFCLLSVLSYLYYLKTDKNKFMYLAFLFSGAAASCKYEFVLYSLFLFLFLFVKNNGLKSVFKSAVIFFIVPLICTIVLLKQGLVFDDLLNYFAILKDFLNQPYLKKVYTITCYFSKYSIISALKTLIAASFVFGVLYKFYEKKFVWALISGWGLWVALTLSVLFYFPLMEYYAYSFWGFITYIVVVLSLFKIKELINDKLDVFLVLASLVISFKSFWYLSTNFYGRYFLPLLVVSLVVVLKKYYFKENYLTFEKTFCAILIFLSVAAFRLNLVSLVLKNDVIKTSYGKIDVTQSEKLLLQPLVDYIGKNLDDSDKLVVLGNAPLLNFLTNKDSIPFYSHYDEAIAGAYGSERIINGYRKYKPDYFVVFEGEKNKQNGYCDTYGKNICKWINENYTTVKIVDGVETVYILKKI